MTETREQVYNGLAQYSDDSEKIALIILEIGEDPDASEFPDGTLNRGVDFFASMGEAKAKAIASGREDVAIATQENAMVLLQNSGMSFPPEVVLLFAEAAVQEGSDVALGIQALREASYSRQRKAGDVKFAQKILKDMGASSNIIQEVFSPESVKAFVEAEVTDVPDWDTQKFLTGLTDRRKQRNQLQSSKQQEQAALPQPNVTRETVRAFLAARK